MFKKNVLSIIILILICVPSVGLAQFEGQIVFDSYEVDAEGTQRQNDELNLYLTKDRILLEGKNRYNVIGSIKTEGVLVRLDFEDFVFLNGEETALKISKQDITSMMNMFSNGNSGRGLESEERINRKNTGETMMINGFRCEKYILTDRENPGDYAVVWMTPELDINWGMLSEPWGNADMDMLGDNLSFDLVFRQGYFPLRIEGYESGNLREITNVREISRSNVARAMVQIPSGVKVLSFQDYLFSKMSEQ